MSEQRPHYEDEVRSEQDVQLDEPPLYKVVLLNDDYTTMEFVVDILVGVPPEPRDDPHRHRGHVPEVVRIRREACVIAVDGEFRMELADRVVQAELQITLDGVFDGTREAGGGTLPRRSFAGQRGLLPRHRAARRVVRA